MANSAQDFITSAPTPVTIANGGTGATTQTAALDALSPLTTKGNLIVHDGTNNVRHALGADGKVLVAELAQTNGLFWTEVLPWTVDITPFMTPIASVGTWVRWVSAGTAANDLYNGFMYNSTDAQNDSISWDVVLAAGTWTLEILTRKSTDQGIVTALLDATTLGTMDLYNGALQYNRVSSIASIAVTSTNKYRLTLKLATKNASSTAYEMDLQHVQWRRTA